MINKIKISKNFEMVEFQCPCCKQVKIDSGLLTKLQKLRDKLGSELYITSGYRCERENERAGGVRNSYHMQGLAADVWAAKKSIYNIGNEARELGFTGIGIYKKKSIVHLDIRPGDRKVWEE